MRYSGWSGRSAVGASPATCWAAPSSVEISILALLPSGGPQIFSAVVRGTTTDSSRSALRSVFSMIPVTVKGWSPTKTAGRVSSVVMPSRDATPEPMTATYAPSPDIRSS